MRIMLKNLAFAIIFLTALSHLYGQENQFNNAAAIDLSPTLQGLFSGGYGIGVSYEIGFLEKFSAIGVVNYQVSASPDLTNNISNYSMTGLGVRLRYYAYGVSIDGAFIGLGTTYSMTSFLLNSGEKTSGTIIYIPGEIGYKYVFTDFFNMFIEGAIGMSFYYVIGGYSKGYMNFTTTDIGLRLGIAF